MYQHENGITVSPKSQCFSFYSKREMEVQTEGGSGTAGKGLEMWPENKWSS